MGGNFVWCSLRLHSGAVTFQCFYIYDLFLFANGIDIASYADGNTPYVTLSKTNLAIEKRNSVLTVFSHGFKIME